MVGNSDQLSEDHGFLDGWRSKTFHFDIGNFLCEIVFTFLT
jgi:hypothetical protein